MKLTIHLATLAALGLLLPAWSAELPGKITYEKTCKQCHGPEGKGDKLADRFWKLTVPRLNSEYVQRKSDAELKGIISGGIRKMEPVRMDAPTGPHRYKLTPEQVDDVVAYVRTLKR